MALLLAQPGIEPAGQFDLNLHDDQVLLGGEIGVFETVGLINTYQVIKVRLATTGDTGPFFLLDDGSKGYGTNFGSTVVRTSTGFAAGSDNAPRLGPPTFAGSNKVTIWNKPGFYAVTLDALSDSEAALKAASPGTGLTIEVDGTLKLGNIAPQPLAYVVQFKVDESLVTTGGNVVDNKKLIICFNPFGTLL
jgi:hypothetical protein